jgi:hypothetical protein
MNIRRTFILASAAVISLACISGCTSEPIVSRKGVSGLAAAEMGIETLMALNRAGGMPNDFGNMDVTDKYYLGGLIPVKKTGGPDRRIDNGTRFFVDGRKRGCLPRVMKVSGPGPHTVRLEIPAFQPYELTLTEVVQLRIGQTEVAAWPPVIVDCLSGEIFTTHDTAAVNPNRNSGLRSSTDLTKKAGGTPLLIVTTTDKKQPGWRKIGQLRSRWRG